MRILKINDFQDSFFTKTDKVMSFWDSLRKSFASKQGGTVKEYHSKSSFSYTYTNTDSDPETCINELNKAINAMKSHIERIKSDCDSHGKSTESYKKFKLFGDGGNNEFFKDMEGFRKEDIDIDDDPKDVEMDDNMQGNMGDMREELNRMQEEMTRMQEDVDRMLKKK